MAITRRADLTYQHNTMNGRHGWLRLTPAYSVKVVDDIIRSWPEDSKVLDPFSGTATTPLCSSSPGHQSAAIDINPFLVWFGRAKLATYRGGTRGRWTWLASYWRHMGRSNKPTHTVANE